MSTQTITLRLPASISAFVEEQTAEGGFESPAEFIQAVLDSARKCKGKRKLQGMLTESLKGKSFPATKEWWDQFFANLKAKYEKKARH